jgi:hypothetical protein
MRGMLTERSGKEVTRVSVEAWNVNTKALVVPSVFTGALLSDRRRPRLLRHPLKLSAIVNRAMQARTPAVRQEGTF